MNLPKAIAALPKWADEYPSRYQLDCIRLRADGRLAYAEATDGCRMCRLQRRSVTARHFPPFNDAFVDRGDIRHMVHKLHPDGPERAVFYSC